MGNMTMALKLIISCEALSLDIPFDSACFAHTISKATQDATYDDKISKDLDLVNVKIYLNIPSSLHHMAKNVRYVDMLIVVMQAFVAYEMFNSLCIVSKGAK